MATANNRVGGPDYPYLLSNDWAPPYRQERIVQMIEEQTADGGKITMAGMAAMQGDQTSTQVADLLPFFLAVPAQDERQQAAIDQLQGWDGNLALDSVPAAIYEAWMLHFDRALFADDLRGGLYDEMAARSNPIFLLNVLSDPVHRTVWCDDVLSIETESCDATATEALDQALDDLEARLGKDMTQWQWRKLHIARFPHNPFSQVSYLAWLFDRSIPNGGDRYTVDAAPVKLGDPYNQYPRAGLSPHREPGRPERQPIRHHHRAVRQCAQRRLRQPAAHVARRGVCADDLRPRECARRAGADIGGAIEVGGRRSEVGSRRSEVGGQKSSIEVTLRLRLGDRVFSIIAMNDSEPNARRPPGRIPQAARGRCAAARAGHCTAGRRIRQ